MLKIITKLITTVVAIMVCSSVFAVQPGAAQMQMQQNMQQMEQNKQQIKQMRQNQQNKQQNQQSGQNTQYQQQ